MIGAKAEIADSRPHLFRIFNSFNNAECCPFSLFSAQNFYGHEFYICTGHNACDAVSVIADSGNRPGTVGSMVIFVGNISIRIYIIFI